MKNKIILSSVLLIVLMLGLSAITAADTNTNNTLEKQTTDTTTPQVSSTKEVTSSDNKEVKSGIKNTETEITPKKEIKTKTLKKETEIDYYVSDEKGRDTNDGSRDNPYKTINQAITQTTADNIYNIHITEGNYTGVGNTNLTVNGDYKINFIGDGINKTVIDGDAKYTIKPNPGYVWGSSKPWWWYINCSGNRAMNITNGTGHITLSNMNIQHMYAPGGADISLNPCGGVTNYGNLSVNNVFFYQNLGGVGAGIQNKANATLTVNNSIFQENRKGNTTGNFGAGIYNNGTASVTNTLFKGNLARWGTVTNDNIIDLVNCTFRDGISYDGASTYKFGTGIAANTGGASFYNPYDLDQLVTNVINCTFINNEQTDIYVGLGNLFVNNCKFNHSTGIYAKGSSDSGNVKTEIYNSTFNDMQSSNLFSSLSVTRGTTFAIYLSTTGNVTLQGNVINLPKDGYGIYVYNNATITNNTLNKYIYIHGSGSKITNNIIKTNDNYAIELTSLGIGGYNEITNNTLYSQVFTGNKAILSYSKTNTIKDNIPETGSYINLTDDNYNTYFDNNGVIRTGAVENGSTITISTDIKNKNLTFSNIKALLLGSEKVNIINGSVKITNNASMIIQNTTIKNNDKNQYGILVNTPYNFIKNNNISAKTTNPYTAIKVTQNNNNLESNIINITSTANNTGISVNSSDNTLKNNKINITTQSTTNTTSTGITLNNSNENYLENNNIYIDTNKDAMGTILINSNKNTIQNGIYIYTSENAIGTHLQNSNNNRIAIHNMELTSNKTVYGIKASGNPTLNSNNTFIKEYGNSRIISNKSITVFLENTRNTSVVGLSGGYNHKVTGNYARGILTKNTEDTNIYYLTLYISALTDTNPNLIAIEQINSKNTNITSMAMKKDSTYNSKGNFLKLTNTTNTYLGSAQDVSKTEIEIPDAAVIMENSNNNIIENVSITTERDYVINLTNSNNNKITNNYLNGNNFSGGDSTVIRTNSKNNTISNNTPEILILRTDNYDDYFTNQIFTSNASEIILGSDLYDKNMTFNHAVALKNPKNYTIYNGTITITHSTGTRSNLTNLQFNVTDDRKTVINIMAGRVNINCSNIMQYNRENQAQTIYVNNQAYINLSYSNILLYAPEINSDDLSKISTAAYQYSCTALVPISHSNITINITKTVPDGKILGLYKAAISYSNLIINGKNNAVGAYINYMANSNMSITAKNHVTGVLIDNSYKDALGLSFTFSNLQLYSDNLTVGMMTDSQVNKNNTSITTNNINLTSPNIIGLKLINSTGKVSNTALTMNGINNTAVHIENSKTWSVYGTYISNSDIKTVFNNITDLEFRTNTFTTDANIQNTFKNIGNLEVTYLRITNSSSNIQNTFENIGNITYMASNITLNTSNKQNIFKNIESVLFTNNNITIEKQKNTPLILLENVTVAQIINNYLKTEDLRAEHTVKAINVTKLIMKLNKPGISITNENYNQYFTNQILNADIDSIELGSDLINKNMTFNHQVSIENPNNYTIYNGTIIFTENAANSTMNEINIHNTDDRESTIIVNSNLITITESGIYQKNDNNPMKTLIVNNANTFKFYKNNIETHGKNITIISLNNMNGTNSITYNNIKGKASYIRALDIYGNENAKMTVSSNNITLESENPVTAIKITGSNGGSLSSNTIIIKTKNYDTPIIELINHTKSYMLVGNYLESEDVCGIDTVKVTGTGRTTMLANKPTTGNYKTQINMTLPPEIKIGKTYQITINVTSMMDKAVNGTVTVTTENNKTVLTLTNGTATYNYTPTKEGETTINITYTDTDKKYAENTLKQTVTVNKINAILKIDPVKGTPNTKTDIPITLTDEYENPLNGEVTVTDQYGNTLAIVTITNGNGTFSKLFRGNINENLTFIYEETETHNPVNTTVNIDIHKLSTTVTINPINAQIGDKISITAAVTDEDGNPVTNGKVIFKVNGKTLRDMEGNIIYATVINGTATIENYTIPVNWYNSKAKISILYGGNNKYEAYRSTNITMNITKRTATMTLTPNTTTPKPGQTITLTTKITDKDTTVNTGSVIFKINGKTLKDNKGQAIYHNVINGTATLNYTIPANANPKNYTFTCVYGNTLYERCDVNSTITVVKN